MKEYGASPRSRYCTICMSVICRDDIQICSTNNVAGSNCARFSHSLESGFMVRGVSSVATRIYVASAVRLD